MVDSELEEALCAVALAVSLLQCFYGYKLLKVTLFIAGFTLLGGVCALIAYRALDGISHATTITIAVLVVTGVGGGSAAVTLYTAGLVLIGAMAGAAATLYLQPSVIRHIPPEDSEVPFYASLVVLMLLGIVVVWRLQKIAVVGLTAFAGAYGAVATAGYFIGSFPNPFDLDHDLGGQSLEDDDKAKDLWWAYCGAVVLLACLGFYAQFHHTAKHVVHEHRPKASANPGSYGYAVLA